MRCYNTNTKKIVDATFPVSIADVPIASVSHAASRIVFNFTNPADAATRRPLPTSRPTDVLSVSLDGKPHDVTSSLVDATNPAVFARLDGLTDTSGFALPAEKHVDGRPAAVAHMTPVLADLRQAGAVRMGLGPDAQAQPEIALFGASYPEADADAGVDVVMHALSMGVLRKAVPMAVGMCLCVARALSLSAETRNDSEGEAGR